MTDRLHILPKHRTILESLLKEHLPDVEVWAYGSRVNRRSHDGSDLDLVLRGPNLKKIPENRLFEFQEAVRESRIPFLIEAQDWARLPERFHTEINRMHVLLRHERSNDYEHEADCVQAPFATLLLEPVRNGIYKPKQFHGRGVKMVNMGELFANPRLGNVQMRRVELTASENQRFGVREGDLLFARRSLVAEGAGKCCVVLDVSEPTAFESSIIRARPDQDKADSLFLYYYFNSPLGLHGLDSIRRQVAVAGITGSDLANLELQLPTVSYQRAIAHILGTLDDKIELNQRMNETLEAMARAIFKDWFIDFGPTRAKAEGRAPYLSSKLWRLFPDALDEECKPDEWTRERIGVHVITTRGLSYKGAGLTGKAGGIPLHNLNSIIEGGGYKTDGLKFYSGNYKPRHIVRQGDLIVANTEQGFDHLLIGYSALIPTWVGKEGLFSHHIYKIEPREASPLSRVWLHFALSSSWFGEVVRQFSNGTTVNMLPLDAFEIPEIIVPPAELVQAFDKFVESMLRGQDHAVGESQNLTTIRDLLLPKLMSGEIRLTQAEKIVKDVV